MNTELNKIIATSNTRLEYFETFKYFLLFSDLATIKNSMTINIAIAGLGNCASSLIQGIYFYKEEADVIGLMHYDLGGYTPSDIKVVAAFDIDKRKVGKRIDQAIASPPNCVYPIKESIIKKNVEVKMGHILDGVSEHLRHQPPHRTFLPSDKAPADIVQELIDSKEK